MKPLVLVAVLVALVVPSALAAPGDPRVVAGTLVWPPILQSEPFAVVRGHDGRFYYADLASLGERDATALRAGDRIAVTGAEGARPHEIVVARIGSENALLNRPENEASPQPSASPPTLEPSATTAVTPQPPRVERLDGRVDAISSRRMVLRTSDGRHLSIDLGLVSESVVGALKRGDRVTVFGSRGGDTEFAAVALIYSGEPG